MTHGEELINMKMLMIDDELTAQTASGRAARALIKELRDRDIAVIEATSDADGQAVVLSDPSLESILLDWTLGDDDVAHDKARALLAFIRRRNTYIPIFLIAKRDDASTLSSEVMREADELIWMLEDTTFFIARRVLAAIRRYRRCFQYGAQLGITTCWLMRAANYTRSRFRPVILPSIMEMKGISYTPTIICQRPCRSLSVSRWV